MAVNVEKVKTFRTEYLHYSAGFLIALALIIFGYLLTTNHWLSGNVLAIALLAVAAVLMFVQLTVFLEVGRAEKGPKLNTYSVAYMFAIAIIVIGCSVWIMYHMNVNMGMTPQQMQQYMLDQNSKGF